MLLYMRICGYCIVQEVNAYSTRTGRYEYYMRFLQIAGSYIQSLIQSISGLDIIKIHILCEESMQLQ